jgi:hypothetical protein
VILIVKTSEAQPCFLEAPDKVSITHCGDLLGECNVSMQNTISTCTIVDLLLHLANTVLSIDKGICQYLTVGTDTNNFQTSPRTSLVRLLNSPLSRSYSWVIGSEGLWPQLIRCAPFPSTAPYFKGTEITCPEVQIYSILIS